MSHFYKVTIVTKKILNVFTLNFILFFILPLVACPLWGQAMQKKQLTGKDYHLWGELNIDKISPDQKWVSYKINYQSAGDTLFVRNIQSNKTYNFPDGDQVTFTKNNGVICRRGEELQILDLKTGQLETISKVNDYNYCDSSDLLILSNTSDNNNMIIRTPFGKTLQKIQNVVQFWISPDKSNLAYSVFSNSKYSLFLLNLKRINSSKWLVSNALDNFDGFTWQKDGKSFAFFSKLNNTFNQTLYYYILQTDKLYELNTSAVPGFQKNASLFSDSAFRMVISDDLQKVFFRMHDQWPNEKNESGVEIWNANDKWIYPQEKKQGQFEKAIKIILWQPLLKRITPITTTELPKIILSGDKEFAILSNPKDYEPQFDEEGPKDFYLMNLKTLEKSKILTKQPGNFSLTIASPQGKYIAYFKENNWWIYNIKVKTHTNITAKIGVKFSGKVHLLDDESPYGNPGWSIDDNEVLLYDQYDLWAVTPNGTKYRRLTHGRESHIKFRLTPIPNIKPLQSIFGEAVIKAIDLEKDIYLRAEGDDGKTGYFKWISSTGENKIVYENSYIDQLNYNSKKQILYYREQRYDLSPRLMSKQGDSNPQPVFQSNPQQQQYYWGKSELVEYQNSKKQNLKGVLLYPANYDPSTKYPMIVRIYELQSQMLHQYRNPSYYNEDGFNPTLFTTQGYFVFLPDIIHEKENVGISATDCVASGIQKIINMQLINPEKIGLMGHSFGGYESVFIITQTHLFATAIASGGITDLTSLYLTVNQNSGKPDMWRFQSKQWRIGKTPFEAASIYERNSPILHAQNIKTPLLLWTGKQDEQVDSHQSIELYLALRRLGKKNIMLLYPNEGHVINDPTQQKDLNVRIEQWFAYFLKDERSVNWISSGIM